jgi:alkylation response protein AidB-like acyl-CoA dehydrogenase
MDLSLSDHHLRLRADVRRFVAEFGHLSPPVGGGGGRARPDRKALDWQARLIEAGYAARSVPRRYGGYGAKPDALDAAIIAEEFNKSGVSLGIQGQGIRMLVPTLLEVGTEEQRARRIGPTVRGEVVWCQGYSEPEAGSDLASLRTRAGGGGRAFRHQRPEDLDQLGALRRHDVPALPHRARQAEA